MNQRFYQVLVVEDEPLTRTWISRVLQRAGYTVRALADGAKAKSAVEDECPNFLITGLQMPDTDGIELCQWLRAKDLPQYVYVLAMTANEESRSLTSSLTAGADDFFRKPILREELLARLAAGGRILQLEHELREASCRDALTQVLNRGAFFAMLEREWSASCQRQSDLACVMLDLDNFKCINDRYGHFAGDAVLREATGRLRSCVRTTDLIGRYGGEEVLPAPAARLTWRGAARCAERCRAAIEASPVSFGELSIDVTASFGVASRSASMSDSQQFLEASDFALLQAKRQGRNQVVLSTAV